MQKKERKKKRLTIGRQRKTRRCVVVDGRLNPLLVGREVVVTGGRLAGKWW